MEVTITGRHFKLTEAIKRHIIKKVNHFNQFLKSIIDVHVILSLENNTRHVAEMIVSARDIKFVVKEETEDLYSSIDKTVDVMEKQLRHHKEKVKEHHGKHTPLPPVTKEESEQDRQKEKPSIIVNSSFLDKPMDMEEAVMELEVQNLQFFVFKDSTDSDKIKIIYKRNDGNFGLIEPS
jgi:putative sigma-54 modulation protein